MNQEIQQLSRNPKKVIWILVALVGLALSFILQNVDWVALICNCYDYPQLHFIVRKVVRVVINDSCMLLLIHSWFDDPKITRLSWKIQLIDMLLLLPIYLILKLTIEGDREISSPLLSQLHRVIVNPILMILIIPGVYFQRLKRTEQ
ncbi:hypothetical protein BH09BAC3_BH09BAC3_12890 [soil metagenome]